MSIEYSEDRLFQETIADYFCDVLRWESAYAYNEKTLVKG